MNTVIRMSIALTILASGLAVVPAVGMPNGTFAWQHYQDVYECTENCLIITSITLEVSPQGDNFLVAGFVTLENENGEPVSDATVSAKWTKPNGVNVGERMTTGENGVAQFEVSSREGVYILTINNVRKTGFNFDAMSSVLSENISVPLNALELSLRRFEEIFSAGNERR